MKQLELKKAIFAGIVATASAVLAAPGCETYDSPPRPSIYGLEDGALADNTAPIYLVFSEPVVTKTLRVQVVKLVTDTEGNLGDEDDDDATQLQSFFANDPVTANNFGGKLTWSEDRTTARIDLDATLPIGPSLAVLIEPGLSDDEGREQKTRERLVFAYRLDCTAAGAPTDFPNGTYFFIANVVKPIDTQIQLLGVLEVDPETGQFNGQFTNADRNPDDSRCSPPCDETTACRTIPIEACVPPSEKSSSDNEYPDFVPNPTPPAGYTFSVGGCVVQHDNTYTFINQPADVDIQQPDVFVAGIQLIASFEDD
ncbi:MAG TPA: hypothetical protein VL400_27805, partial [Polyangiaceae bacterium]|nr:hypothetical protein [Polyangiaceae bacterium]